MEYQIDIVRCLCTAEDECGADGLGVLLSDVLGNGRLAIHGKISLVSNDQDLCLWCPGLVDHWQPCFCDGVERPDAVDVIHKHHGMRASEVLSHNRLEALLSSSVPDLQLQPHR